MKKSLSLLGLFLFASILFILVACNGEKEKTANEKAREAEVQRRLEIAEAGDVIRGNDGVYSIIIAVDGMPAHINRVMRLQTAGMRDTDWRDINLEHLSVRVSNVYLYNEGVLALEKATYAEALRNAVLGIVKKVQK
jgi:hypothetical protein